MLQNIQDLIDLIIWCSLLVLVEKSIILQDWYGFTFDVGITFSPKQNTINSPKFDSYFAQQGDRPWHLLDCRASRLYHGTPHVNRGGSAMGTFPFLCFWCTGGRRWVSFTSRH